MVQGTLSANYCYPASHLIVTGGLFAPPRANVVPRLPTNSYFPTGIFKKSPTPSADRVNRDE
jgi:hypothetical protein